MNNYTIITANRASSLLYSFLTSGDNRPYLIPANVCPVIPMTFRLANINFSFADIDGGSLCIDKQSCYEFVKKHNGYAGIVYVRTYGSLVNEESFFGDLKEEFPNSVIIDDRCLCLPSFEIDDTVADLVLYSTGYAKQVDLGGGGFCFVRNNRFTLDNKLLFVEDNLNERCRALFEKGEVVKAEEHIYWLKVAPLSESDINYREQVINKINDRERHRASINEIYKTMLPKDIQLADNFLNWRFNIRVEHKLQERIIDSLFKNGLFASWHYKPVNRLFNEDRLKESEQLADTVINLFNDYHYTEIMAEQTAELVVKVLIEENKY